MEKNLTVGDIIKCTKGKIISGNVEEVCKTFSKDTRNINVGDTYIAIKGENFNGNKFWKEALEKGAKTVIIEEFNDKDEKIEKYKDKNIILVKDTLKALQEIAKYKRNLYNIPVIAVTGSVGKTSTKDIIASVVSTKYKTLKTEGNNNNEIGLPLTILKLKDEEALVIEMGMNHFGEISVLTQIAKPTLAIITNIGTSHIGNLGSRENILKAKLEIIEGMKEVSIVINNDNDLLNEWYNENKEKYEINTYGIKNQSNVMAKKINLKENSSNFTAEINEEKISINVPVGGQHFVYNAMCAIMVGKKLNISNEQIKQGIKSFELTKKRMEILKSKNGATIINDSYNASYESMKVAIEYLASMPAKRKIAILGDMFELGKYAEELHKKVGKEIEKNKIDILICCGENSKNIIKEVKESCKVYYCNDINEIVELANKILTKDDVVLIKASNGMKFFNIVSKII